MTDPGIILFGKKIGSSSLDGRENMEEAIAEKGCLIDEEGVLETSHATEGDPMNLQPRTLRKPDKILPCPRCDSMNTKFCYFNNSNVNQPRHFCKSCQRYWTAGGTMRNMPVGAGRRKKKTPPSHCRYIISQEAFESEAAAAVANHIEFAPDSEGIPPKVLSFGQNSPCFGADVSGKESRDDCSSSSIVENIQDNTGFHSHFHWIQGASWPYNPWNTPTPIPMPIPMPIPPMYPPGYPQIPMYPSPYWSSVSWLPPTDSILGKHPTDVEAIKPDGSNDEFKKQRNSILIPKTLRIDDPDEAAKSSIWATLGIKNEHSGRGDLFKSFQSKGNEKKKNKTTEPSPVLQANPAAFSRSLRFQERA